MAARTAGDRRAAGRHNGLSSTAEPEVIVSKRDKKESLSRKHYEHELERLQTELAYMQRWVRETGARVIVIFEGRDAAGKGGAIKRLTERVSARVFRVVALPAPTDREKTQIYMQRYFAHFPAAGEVTVFDRSWYNRAGVERVMGFATEDEVQSFLESTPAVERALVDEGIHFVKFFFHVTREEQQKRFRARYNDPMRQWKLSPIDMASWARWWDYTAAYAEMFKWTDTAWAPWYVVEADDKRRARLNCLAQLLDLIPYEKLPYDQQDPPDPVAPKKKPAAPVFRNVVPDRY
jgi:polyphosphate kinase 2